MNFSRLVFNHAVKQCSKSSSRIKFNNKFWTVNAANFCSVKPRTKTVVAGIINSREYCSGYDINLLTQTELERFNATFPLIVEILTKESDVQNEIAKDGLVRVKEIMEYTVSSGRQKFGKTLVSAYKVLAKSEDLTEENMKLANILGWCVEMLFSFFALLDDIMDHSVTRRGKPCWFRIENVGLMAINDAVMLASGVFYILKKNFQHLPYYVHIVESLHEVIRLSSYGQNLDMMYEYSSQSPNFEIFTEDKLKALSVYKTTYYAFFFTMKLILTLAGWPNETFKSAEQILMKMGESYQVQDDYLDCYYDPVVNDKRGMDIEGGKLTWPIVTALKMASEEQTDILKKNFGIHDENSVMKVKQVYDELELPKLYEQYKEETFRELTMLIDNLKNSTNLPPELFHLFMQTLYKQT